MVTQMNGDLYLFNYVPSLKALNICLGHVLKNLRF